MGFNKVAVSQFCYLLTKLIENTRLQLKESSPVIKLGFHPKTQSKIKALKGKHQMGALTSAERDETVTGVCACQLQGHLC